LHQTKPFVTHLAFARSAPNSFAGETNVIPARSILVSDLIRLLLEAQILGPVRRKCFVSYYGGDRVEVEAFLQQFSDVFIPKVIGVSSSDDFINSTDSGYVMSKIREKYLGDSTVTLCMIGNCTHSRRYIDWELKTTLRRGSYIPNGLVGIILRSAGTRAYQPPRFFQNWGRNESAGYAIYRSYPTSSSALTSWIEEAYKRRTSHSHFIANSQEMMKYNRSCGIHNVTH
jgi:Thoeris protein ThsB, TIR-like domain